MRGSANLHGSLVGLSPSAHANEELFLKVVAVSCERKGRMLVACNPESCVSAAATTTRPIEKEQRLHTHTAINV